MLSIHLGQVIPSHSQQAVSSLTDLPDNMFQGSGAVFTTLGFEYWANPSNRDEGFITWQVDGTQSYRMGAAAMGPDQGPDGTLVGQRIIPEEPMSIILNLGISRTYNSLLADTWSSAHRVRTNRELADNRPYDVGVPCDHAVRLRPGISEVGLGQHWM